MMSDGPWFRRAGLRYQPTNWKGVLSLLVMCAAMAAALVFTKSFLVPVAVFVAAMAFAQHKAR